VSTGPTDADRAESQTALPNVGHAVLRDPLTELTRSTRKHLLLASVVGIIIASTGLVPTKIDALGVEFSADEQAGLRFALSGILFYFAVEFLLYAWTDFVRWKTSIYEALLVHRREWEKANPFQPRSVKPPQWSLLATEVKLRLIVDFLFPPALAVVALFLLALKGVNLIN